MTNIMVSGIRIEKSTRIESDRSLKLNNCPISVQRVRKTALALAKSISPTPDLLIIELGLHLFLSFSSDRGKRFETSFFLTCGSF